MGASGREPQSQNYNTRAHYFSFPFAPVDAERLNVRLCPAFGFGWKVVMHVGTMTKGQSECWLNINSLRFQINGPFTADFVHTRQLRIYRALKKSGLFGEEWMYSTTLLHRKNSKSWCRATTGGEGNSHLKCFGSFDKLEPADWRDSLRTESIGMLAVKTLSDCDCYYHCHWLSWTFNRLKLRLPSLLLQVAYIFFF